MAEETHWSDLLDHYLIKRIMDWPDVNSKYNTILCVLYVLFLCQCHLEWMCFCSRLHLLSRTKKMYRKMIPGVPHSELYRLLIRKKRALVREGKCLMGSSQVTRVCSLKRSNWSQRFDHTVPGSATVTVINVVNRAQAEMYWFFSFFSFMSKSESILALWVQCIKGLAHQMGNGRMSRTWLF